MHKYMVASSDTVKPKTKSFNKTPEIREGDIPEGTRRKPSEQSSSIHARPQYMAGITRFRQDPSELFPTYARGATAFHKVCTKAAEAGIAAWNKYRETMKK